jgi:hypothetical protein
VGVRVVEKLWIWELVKVLDIVPVGDTEEDMGKAVQTEAPAAEVMPLGQGTHEAMEDAPTAELLVPAGQGVASPFDMAGQKYPAGQVGGRKVNIFCLPIPVPRFPYVSLPQQYAPPAAVFRAQANPPKGDTERLVQPVVGKF